MGCGSSKATQTATEPYTSPHAVETNENFEPIKPLEVNGSAHVNREEYTSAKGKHESKDPVSNNEKRHENDQENDHNKVIASEMDNERCSLDENNTTAEKATEQLSSSEERAFSQTIPNEREQNQSGILNKSTHNQTESISRMQSLEGNSSSWGDNEGVNGLIDKRRHLADLMTFDDDLDEPPTTNDGSSSTQARETRQEEPAPPVSKDTSASSAAVAELTNQKSNAVSPDVPPRKSSVQDTASSAYSAENPSAHGEGANTPNNENTAERICSLSASVVMPSEDSPLSGKNVTLSGSVFRLPNMNPDKIVAGKKIGYITGEITAANKETQTEEKIATIRGSLFAADEDAASDGKIAYSSVDVISCSSGEHVAIITADVYPDTECMDQSSAVITGEVIALSRNGTSDEPIGTIEGRVIALVFQEGKFEFSGDEE